MNLRLERGVLIRRLAPAALMPAGAFAVHQLRYWLAFGNRAGMELAAQGHSYLHSLVPWIVLLIALACGAFLLTLGRTLGGGVSLPRYTLSFVGLWAVCAACVVAVYITQELLEGFFLTGHPAGMTGVFGYGGWWSIPAAVAVGLVLAAAFHGARRVLQAVAERRAQTPTAAVRAPVVAHLRVNPLLPALAPLADGWSGRGPPLG
ncbi:MAG TPA: hypothetical protein VMB27_22545 [Solirubrobacteraceae bacterium]|nr:hypothetical protein [Solirubrobacteraceae bacterium]